MRVSYHWLKDYIDLNLSAEELAEKLTMAGLAVEGVAPPVPGLEQIVVGKITALAPHPNSEHLLICRVETGAGVLQIVSGAPNLEVGINVAVARPGTTLPSGMQVTSRFIRGIASEGLLCSGAELGTQEWGYGDERGVLVLDPEIPPGTRLDRALGLDDQILEFDLTPNRGDCLAVVNIAREASALTGGRLDFPEIRVHESGERTENFIRVEIAEPALCRRYAGRIVRNVKIAPSPPWLRYRLRAAGIRPINNIVDVTNYVMLELGQPLHAFDYDRLQGAQIIVRRARPGEKLVSLDGVTRVLNEEMLVIADARTPVALAGIMGGLASEVTEQTRTVLLEAAYFDPLNIRRTAKLLDMRTESSLRFEKGINLDGVVRALNRAAQLIEQLGAGTVAAGVVDEYIRPAAPLAIRLRTARVNHVLGTSLTRAEVQEILSRLGFICELCGPDSLLVNIPPYRVDIGEEIDLIEEVARLYGYDRIRATIPVGVLSQGVRRRDEEIKDLVAEVMLSAGLDEAITYSFINEGSLARLGLPEESPYRQVVRLKNPLREEQGVLRPLLLPGLLETIAYNYKHKLTNLGFFELGKIFEPAGEGELPHEKFHLGIAVCGETDRGWQEPGQVRDFYEVKGIVEHLLATLGIKDFAFLPWRDFPPLHPGRAAQIFVGSLEVGFLGELHPDVLENLEISARVVGCELDLAKILPLADLRKVFEPLPRYPGITRDLAVVAPLEVPAARITEVIRKAGGSLLRECRLFDVYQGPQVPAGSRSLAYSLFFQSPDRTLTDEEVSAIHRQILEALAAQTGARLR
ncbi:MAG: phenylalanine--tRNA ligase subunit beta [Firmicutes bacterium]|nr:phenylalanine--tRNA ligase subunit beta [Bacillota bacterium]